MAKFTRRNLAPPTPPKTPASSGGEVSTAIAPLSWVPTRLRRAVEVVGPAISWSDLLVEPEEYIPPVAYRERYALTLADQAAVLGYLITTLPESALLHVARVVVMRDFHDVASVQEYVSLLMGSDTRIARRCTRVRNAAYRAEGDRYVTEERPSATVAPRVIRRRRWNGD